MGTSRTVRRGGFTAAAATLLLAAVLCHVAPCDSISEATDAERDLIQWLKDEGGQVEFEIGRACDTCIRGAIATRDIKDGEQFFEIPMRLMVSLGSGDTEQAVVAAHLLRRMHASPSFNATWRLWWESQPPLDTMVVAAMLTEEQREELQSEELANLALSFQDSALEVYEGLHATEPGLADSPLPGTGYVVPLHQYQHVHALLISRAFAFNVNDTEEEATFMVPVLDMLNHDDDPNSRRVQEYDTERGEWVVRSYAERDIRKGEEIRHVYTPSILHRNDASFLLYGFIRNVTPPLLWATDLPEFDYTWAFNATDLDDDLYNHMGRVASRDVFAHFTRVWSQLPTSLREDREMLGFMEEDGHVFSATEDMILRMRLMRKQALTDTIHALWGTVDEL